MMTEETARECMSHEHTVGEYLSSWKNGALDNLDIWEILCEDNVAEAMKREEIAAWEPFENWPLDELATQIDAASDNVSDLLKEYGECIKHGMVIMAIEGALDSDMTQLDMDTLATIGRNTSYPQTIAGITVRFEALSGEWLGDGGQALKFDHQTGLPILDLFEHYTLQPPEVRAIYDKYAKEDSTYLTCTKLQKEMEAVGYTFDWGLDAAPSNLRKMTND